MDKMFSSKGYRWGLIILSSSPAKGLFIQQDQELMGN